jgi:type I restriction-modification system DNA methylase subunit
MSKTYDQGREEIVKLCKYFADNRIGFFGSGVKEAHVRQALIDPFFETLGWDVRNTVRVAPQYREVITEDSLEIEGQQKAPDYTFRVGTLAKFYTEAKKCGVNINADPAPAYQLRRYGWSAKVPLSILTDFEELGVYDCSQRPRPVDKASFSRIQYFRSEEYPDRWRELWDIFSREAVWGGAFDRFAASKRKRGTSEVDSEFLKEIEGWRDSLARNIALRNQFLAPDDLNTVVQRTIDRIIFLRMAEDRGSEPYGELLKLSEQPNIYSRFMSRSCKKADEKYNSGLFHFQKEEGIAESADQLTPKLQVDDKVFKPILQSLYFEHGSPYHFGVLPVEMLGTVYERFLGKVIRLTPEHRAKVEEKPEVRKAGGVYYTPSYIVDYIVANTVGKMIEGKSPAQLAGNKNGQPLRVLDMACGSGSFLLGAFKCLLDHCQKWYEEHQPVKFKDEIYKNPKGEWRLAIAEKKRILTTHIFGVDIDPQAVEVSKLSLLLKVMEGETDETVGQSRMLFHKRALPNLSLNIKCGNSLIGPDYFSGRLIPDPDEMKRVNPFDWNREFPEAMKSGGFDCVIGNPPYGADYSSNEKDFFQNKYTYKKGKPETYIFFIERGIEILIQKGLLGYITPNAWLTNYYGIQLRRHLFSFSEINQIVDLEPTKVFEKAVVDTSIIITVKNNHQNLNHKTEVFRGTKDYQINYQFSVLQSNWEKDSEGVINLQTNPLDLVLINKIEQSGLTLESIIEYSQGVIPYKTRSDGETNLYISNKQLNKKWLPLFENASQVRRYELDQPTAYINYGNWLWCPRDIRFFIQPKILFHRLRKKLPKQLIGAFDDSGTINRHSLSNLIARPNISPQTLFAVLGIFNSKLANWWFVKRYGLLMEVGGFKVAKIPLPLNWGKVQNQLSSLVIKILKIHKDKSIISERDRALFNRQIDSNDREIDRLIYELYGLTQTEIEIIESSE